MIKGEISEHRSGAVYSVDDVAPTLMDDLKVAGELSDTDVVQAKNVYDTEGVTPACMSANGTGSKTKIAVDEIPEMDEGDVISVQTPGHSVKSQNGSRFEENTSFTVTAAGKDGIVEKSEGKLRIRYLTPRECLRLQAFPDDAIR